jgi:hypothetical protein
LSFFLTQKYFEPLWVVVLPTLVHLSPDLIAAKALTGSAKVTVINTMIEP